ncbi:hypothetical protein DL769_003021 [Monosporascus sp. CRB-8-3]|nr:hypothetical protein DL769_003021 [Monosporascus sp. CRB-8-3]
MPSQSTLGSLTFGMEIEFLVNAKAIRRPPIEETRRGILEAACEHVEWALRRGPAGDQVRRVFVSEKVYDKKTEATRAELKYEAWIVKEEISLHIDAANDEDNHGPD